MAHPSTNGVRLAACVAVLIAGPLALGACGRGGSKSGATDTKAKVRKTKEANGSKSHYIEVKAKRRRQDIGDFTRPPYELQGNFEVQLTAGLFKDKATKKIGDGFFGLRIDGGGTTTGEFYAVYAEYDEPNAGLQVFAVTHNGEQGVTLQFPGMLLVDLRAISDGTSIVFSAAERGGLGFQTVAVVGIDSPLQPHLAGYGVFGIDAGARVGFSNFAIPFNDGPPAAKRKSAAQTVQQLFYRGAAFATAAVSAVNRPVPIPSAAQSHVNESVSALNQALFEAEGLPEGRAKNQVKKWLEKMSGYVGIAGFHLENEGEKGKRQFLHYMINDAFPAAFKVHDHIDPLVAGGG